MILKDKTVHYTLGNDPGGGKTYFLDRHSLNCPAGKVMTDFQLQDGGGKVWYKYGCANVSNLPNMSLPSSVPSNIPPYHVMVYIMKIV